MQPTRRSDVSHSLSVLVVWCAVALLSGASIWSMRPPDPLPASASPQAFSAERAMVHVRAISTATHPIGSQAQEAVRKYLVAQLESLGLDPLVFNSVGFNVSGRRISAGKTEDIVGRLKGKSGSRAIVLMAHYDTVNHAPGAADDTASIAAILEAVRALRSDAQLNNDVIVLFTDGEEAGLLGAEAFVAGHPWMKDVGLILNFEARGDRGASLLFETSTGNRQLIEEVLKATPQMVGSSFLYVLYKILPDDTDLTVFGPSGLPRLNFAFGNHFEAYHTRLDTPENLSVELLQLHGTYVLDLTKQFGGIDLNGLQRSSEDEIFFNFFGKRLVGYPQSWIMVAESAITLLLVAVLSMAFWRRELRVDNFLLSLLAVAGVTVVIPAALAVVWRVISSLLLRERLIGDTPSNSLLFAGLCVFGAAIFLTSAAVANLIFRRLHHDFPARALFLAALTFGWLLTLLLAFLLPEGSYILQLPLLLLLLGVFVAHLLKRIETSYLFIAALPGVICGILLFTPPLYLSYIFLTLDYPLVVAAGIVVALFLLLSIPSLIVPAVEARPWFVVPGILFVVSAVCVALGSAKSRYSAENPGPDTLVYALDADRRAAAWISYDRVPDSWVSNVMPAKSRQRVSRSDYLVNRTGAVWEAPAPTIDLPGPRIDVASDTSEGGTRSLVLRLQSLRDAPVMYATLSPKVTLLSARIAGREVPLEERTQNAAGFWSMALYGWRQESVQLELTVRCSSNLILRVADESVGLPLITVERPANLLAWYASDVTLVNRQLMLGCEAPEQ